MTLKNKNPWKYLSVGLLGVIAIGLIAPIDAASGNAQSGWQVAVAGLQGQISTIVEEDHQGQIGAITVQDYQGQIEELKTNQVVGHYSSGINQEVDAQHAENNQQTVSAECDPGDHAIGGAWIISNSDSWVNDSHLSFNGDQDHQVWVISINGDLDEGDSITFFAQCLDYAPAHVDL